MSRTKLDALSVFTILFAQCLTLQVAKDVQSHALTSWRILPTLALALAIVRAHLAPTSDHALVALAASGAVVLCVNGSQSNHVLLELAIAGAVLLCAPASLPVSPSSSPRTTRLKVRRAFASRVSLSMRVALGILYLTTGFAKLNDDWHDPSVSCCVQMLVGALAGLGLSPSAVAAAAPALSRAAAPYAATAFELGFPVVLVLARSTRTVTPIRILTISGAIFHVFIALPPPPMSVYPFSMIMAPMYAVGLLPEETGAAARRVAAWPDEVKIAASTAAVTALALAYQAHASSNLFEYPNYFAWEIGATWVVVVFAAVSPSSRRRRRTIPIRRTKTTTTRPRRRLVGRIGRTRRARGDGRDFTSPRFFPGRFCSRCPRRRTSARGRIRPSRCSAIFAWRGVRATIGWCARRDSSRARAWTFPRRNTTARTWG